MAVLLLTAFFVAYTPQSAASSSFNSKSLSLAETVRFAAIGDYGVASSNELALANLIKNWNPDFIITLGDNNYPDDNRHTYTDGNPDEDTDAGSMPATFWVRW